MRLKVLSRAVVLLQPADGALQLLEVVMKITHSPTSPEILSPESFIAKEYIVPDVHLECQPLKVDAVRSHSATACWRTPDRTTCEESADRPFLADSTITPTRESIGAS